MRKARDGKIWGDYETIRLLKMAADGYTIEEIEAEIDRGAGAIEHKLKLNKWHKKPDGSFRKARAAKYPNQFYSKKPERVGKIDIKDIVNVNTNPKDGKVNPLLYASLVLGKRLHVVNASLVYLDDRRVSIDDMMVAVNKKLVSENKPQITYSRAWVI